MNIIFTKIRDTKLPSVAYSSDAGIDLYIPNSSEEFLEDLQNLNQKLIEKGNELNFYQMREHKDDDLKTCIKIGPSSRVMIPMGVKSVIDTDVALVALNKSGIATKLGLIVGAQVIDSGYRGEIIINFINTSNKTVTLTSGEKVAQLVPIRLFERKLEIVSNDEYEKISKDIELKTIGNSRLDGGFGSSN